MQCPRCQGRMVLDRREGETGCYQCGYVVVTEWEQARAEAAEHARVHSKNRGGVHNGMKLR